MSITVPSVCTKMIRGFPLIYHAITIRVERLLRAFQSACYNYSSLTLTILVELDIPQVQNPKVLNQYQTSTQGISPPNLDDLREMI